jgi:hypothetical protein
LALIDEHVGEPAYAAIIGDPGATHPTISPSRPEHRIAEAVRLLAEAAAATRAGRAH